MKTTSAQVVLPATVFLGLLNGVDGMQISVMPPDVEPVDLMEMIDAAKKHIQSLLDTHTAKVEAEAMLEPEVVEASDAPLPHATTDATAVTLAPGETRSVAMPGGGTFTVHYPQGAADDSADEDGPPLENEGE